MTGGDSMDAISLDDDWELLPDHESSFFVEEYSVGSKDQLMLGSNLVMISMDYFTPGPASHPSLYGPASHPYPYVPAAHPSPYDCVLDEESKKPPPQPLQDASVQGPVVEFKDIGVVQTEPSRGELASKVIEVLISDAEEEVELIKCRAGGEEAYEEDEVMVEAAPDLRGEEEDGVSVGKLRVNGVGALCSFGVAAATFCIFLLGGRQQHQQQKKKMQSQKIQFQMYADDERIQQVVEQASRLNQAMSSIMGGASTRASISFGGYYDGF